MIKLGILTLPPKLAINYGCILQTYALQSLIAGFGLDYDKKHIHFPFKNIMCYNIRAEKWHGGNYAFKF